MCHKIRCGEKSEKFCKFFFRSKQGPDRPPTRSYWSRRHLGFSPSGPILVALPFPFRDEPIQLGFPSGPVNFTTGPRSRASAAHLRTLLPCPAGHRHRPQPERNPVSPSLAVRQHHHHRGGASVTVLSCSFPLRRRLN
jgi:hypothetical protein